MSTIVNIHAAKTHLSRLAEQAAAGEDIVIAKAGHPVARLTALAARGAPRRLGSMAGQFRVPDDFDTLERDEIGRRARKGSGLASCALSMRV